MHTRPVDGLSSAAMQCIRVDLPEPDGPMIAVMRPRAKSTLTPSRARTCASPSPYTLVRSTAWATTRLPRHLGHFDVLSVAAGDVLGPRATHRPTPALCNGTVPGRGPGTQGLSSRVLVADVSKAGRRAARTGWGMTLVRP